MKFTDDVPIYRQIEQYIAGEIISGRFHSGQQVPSVRQLALQFSVNTNTVQRALREMIIKNILESRRGLGNFVTSDPTIIEDLRQNLINKSLLAMYKQLHALNISDVEIKGCLDDFLEKRRSEDGKYDRTEKCLL
ncbi:GntR family transcriptional regulator [Ligilactobacillus acidipiscis]|uniref:GntR family transcriptional regulator n=1 Tax=Ligilactobacillus acidipiscis TaxID=89059 RepID=UPI0022DFC75B|nr:GntR family transcriptional regulator [Ligilactobacillus acidipiscis]WEV57305.1 GntR family transcriptional regulator [Ligilactobacillus acidipiscis]